MAFGVASQLAARFPAQCGQALALGIVAAGPLVLLLQAAVRIGTHPSPLQQTFFFHLCAAAPLAGTAAISVLLSQRWDELQGDKVTTGLAAALDAAGVSEGLLESAGLDSVVEDVVVEEEAVEAAVEDKVAELKEDARSFSVGGMLSSGQEAFGSIMSGGGPEAFGSVMSGGGQDSADALMSSGHAQVCVSKQLY